EEANLINGALRMEELATAGNFNSFTAPRWLAVCLSGPLRSPAGHWDVSESRPCKRLVGGWGTKLMHSNSDGANCIK
ncbi:hypothetical protein TNIN_192521, partial [Trichonephila inaurata madagascariensis]